MIIEEQQTHTLESVEERVAILERKELSNLVGDIMFMVLISIALVIHLIYGHA